MAREDLQRHTWGPNCSVTIHYGGCRLILSTTNDKLITIKDADALTVEFNRFE